MYLGAIGTRPCDIDELVWNTVIQSHTASSSTKPAPVALVLDPGSHQRGDDCWVVAPAFITKKAGDRVKPDRREAVQLARLARSAIPWSMSPQSKMKPSGISPGARRMSSASSKTPSSV